MIEVRRFYLLKGASVSAKPLDDYCVLLSYPEALRKISAEPSAQYWVEDSHWPPETTDNVCALEVKSFERRGAEANEFERHESRLLQCGPESLALILGLVWGKGLRVFGSWQSIARPIAETLPFFLTTSGASGMSQQTLLTLPGFRRSSKNRPLNKAEFVELVDKYAALPGQTQRVLNLALRRLRDSTERIEFDDKVIDVCIALEALFMEEGEKHDHKKLVSRRASWHFADSHSEREQVRTLLKEFYGYRERIVHGSVPENPTPEQSDRRVTQLAEVENVVRASLQTMISEGRPPDWAKSKDFKAIRHDPPRAETEIPSFKSDSLSWSMKEQKEIDQALEAAWKPGSTTPLHHRPMRALSLTRALMPKAWNPLRHQCPHPALHGSPQVAQAGG
ncbi:MAG: HEPN domain-containing protein [Chloroflexi bacterium]|nr:HEPN domain-containing protein [Chloroflexota bacterium]